MIKVKINKNYVENVTKAEVEVLVNDLNSMNFIDLKNLHKAALDHASVGNLAHEDYVSVVAVYTSMNVLKVNDFKWFRIEYSNAGIICCHGTDESDIDIIQSMIDNLSE